jgi:hypothetical protein
MTFAICISYVCSVVWYLVSKYYQMQTYQLYMWFSMQYHRCYDKHTIIYIYIYI